MKEKQGGNVRLHNLILDEDELKYIVQWGEWLEGENELNKEEEPILKKLREAYYGNKTNG